MLGHSSSPQQLGVSRVPGLMGDTTLTRWSFTPTYSWTPPSAIEWTFQHVAFLEVRFHQKSNKRLIYFTIPVYRGPISPLLEGFNPIVIATTNPYQLISKPILTHINPYQPICTPYKHYKPHVISKDLTCPKLANTDPSPDAFFSRAFASSNAALLAASRCDSTWKRRHGKAGRWRLFWDTSMCHTRV